MELAVVTAEELIRPSEKTQIEQVRFRVCLLVIDGVEQCSIGICVNAVREFIPRMRLDEVVEAVCILVFQSAYLAADTTSDIQGPSRADTAVHIRHLDTRGVVVE